MQVRRVEREGSSFQDPALSYTVSDSSGQIIGRGRRHAGIFELGGERRLLVAVKDFWQKHPQEVIVSSDRVEVFLWPRDEVRRLDLSVGVRKTTTMILDLAPPAGDADRLRAYADALRRPPLAACPASWYCKSGALGGVYMPADRERFPLYEWYLSDFFNRKMDYAEVADFTGAFDDGDDIKSGLAGWHNNQTMYAHHLLIQYARTLQPRYWRAASRLLRHVADSDVSWARVARQDFVDGLAAAGVERGDVCFVHSSLIAFGKPAAPANVVMSHLAEALQQAVGPEGTIVMPTFTFSFCKGKVYDVARSKSMVGALTEYFRKCPDVVRTGHPIFSAAIWGKHRDELASVGKDSFGEDTIFAKVHALGGKLVLYGSPFPPTFKHYVEQCHGVPYRFMKTFHGTIKEGDAEREDEATFYVRYLDRNVVSDATRLENRLESLGLIREAAVGGGRIRVMSANEFHDVVWNMLDEDIYSLLKDTPDL